MYARQRNGPGNRYRSNPMGNAAAGSRILPDSMRVHRNYNPEFRNYNRGGYARDDHSKQFQRPLPPPRETGIFVEAGKLAAEYLVSRGVLPPNALSGKWQNNGLKNPMGNFQSSREVENARISTDCVGNAPLDVEHGRRMYSDEYNSMCTRNFARETLRTGSLKNEESSKSYGSEVKREFGKSGSFAERSRVAPGTRADRDVSAGQEQHLGNDGLKNSSPGEMSQGAIAAHLKSELEKGDLPQDIEAKASSLSDAIGEPAKDSYDANQIAADSVAVKKEKNDNEMEQINGVNKEVTDSNRKDGLISEADVDLVKHSKFENVPTKTRSSLTCRGTKSDLEPINEDSTNENKDISEKELSEISAVHTVDVSIDNSTGNASSDQDHELKSFKSGVINDEPVEKRPDITITDMHGKYLRSGSFPEGDLKYDVLKIQELGDLQSELDSSNSMFMDKGGKRAMSDDDTNEKEGFKKLREWVPQMDSQFDDSSPLSSSMENLPTLQEPRTSKDTSETRSNDQNISLFPKGHADTCDLTEEKWFFPGSFKTCDLNLVETCDINENHDVVISGPVFRAVTKTEKETVPIDVDLSISNNCNLSNKNGKQAVTKDDIEIIDLENDSEQEDKGLSYSQRRGDAVFSDLEGFHNANDIPDAEDGYGLMISELLQNSSPNSSSVATGLNSLHNNIVLPDEEGILDDDDSIYLSLGEIPISLLDPWEPPTRDYGKPF